MNDSRGNKYEAPAHSYIISEIALELIREEMQKVKSKTKRKSDHEETPDP